MAPMEKTGTWKRALVPRLQRPCIDLRNASDPDQVTPSLGLHERYHREYTQIALGESEQAVKVT